MGTAWRYALRSLRRNARRTALSVVGIGIGCALALFMESLNRGRDELFARMGAYGGAGHVRIVPRRMARASRPAVASGESGRLTLRRPDSSQAWRRSPYERGRRRWSPWAPTSSPSRSSASTRGLSRVPTDSRAT